MISRTKPTVRTIAAELGVSAMTITRALNGHPKVSTETRRRVLAKVKEVGYDFRASSRTVRQERDRNVAIHCGDDKLYSDNILNFYMRLHYLCQRRLKAEGLRGQLIDLNVHAEAAFPVLDNCGSLILLGPVEQARLETVRKRYPELRIISVFGSVDGVTQVGPDDYEGGAFAARRFAALGHRHAAVFATLSESGFCKRYGGFVAEFQARQPGARVDLKNTTSPPTTAPGGSVWMSTSPAFRRCRPPVSCRTATPECFSRTTWPNAAGGFRKISV